MTKYIAIGGFVVTLLTVAVIFGVYREKVDDTEIVVEKHEVRIQENEKFDVRQSALIDSAYDRMERQTVILEKLEAKF